MLCYLIFIISNLVFGLDTKRIFLITGCDGAPLLPLLFIIVNIGFNISLLHLLKISSAVVSSLASTFSGTFSHLFMLLLLILDGSIRTIRNWIRFFCAELKDPKSLIHIASLAKLPFSSEGELVNKLYCWLRISSPPPELCPVRLSNQPWLANLRTFRKSPSTDMFFIVFQEQVTWEGHKHCLLSFLHILKRRLLYLFIYFIFGNIFSFTWTVPISVYMFTLPLPYIGVASSLPTGFVAGAIILVLGLLVYAWAPSESDPNIAPTPHAPVT